MVAPSQVEVRTVPCSCGIFLDNVNATGYICSSRCDPLAVGEPPNFETYETVCKRKFDFQYKETSYDNDEIST